MWFLIPKDVQGLSFLASVVATFVLMRFMNGKLKTGVAPRGIISLELAGNEQVAAAIIRSWDVKDGARRHAIRSLILDFPLLLAYSTALGLACQWAGESIAVSEVDLPVDGRQVAWGQTLAAVLDVAENFALLIMLRGMVRKPWPQIAGVCALIKFLLIGVGLVYSLLGIALWVGRLFSQGD